MRGRVGGGEVVGDVVDVGFNDEPLPLSDVHLECTSGAGNIRDWEMARRPSRGAVAGATCLGQEGRVVVGWCSEEEWRVVGGFLGEEAQVVGW